MSVCVYVCVCVCVCVCVRVCVCVQVSVCVSHFQTEAMCDKPQWTVIFPEASDGQRISLSFEVCDNIVNLRRKRSSISRNPR